MRGRRLWLYLLANMMISVLLAGVKIIRKGIGLRNASLSRWYGDFRLSQGDSAPIWTRNFMLRLVQLRAEFWCKWSDDAKIYQV